MYKKYNNSSSSIEFEDEDAKEETTYFVSFDYQAWYTPAKIYGDPGDCYPEDYGSDFTITEILQNGKVVKYSELDDSIADKIFERVNDYVGEYGLVDCCDGSEREYDDYSPYDDAFND